MTHRKEMRSQKQRETELKEKQMQNTSKTQEGLTNLYKSKYVMSYSWRIEYCGILSNPGPVDSSLNNVHFIVHEMRFPRVDFIMQSKDIKNCFICEVHHKFNSLLEGFPNAGVIANKWIVSVDTTHTCKHSQVPVLMEPVHHVPALAISRSSFCGL